MRQPWAGGADAFGDEQRRRGAVGCHARLAEREARHPAGGVGRRCQRRDEALEV
jgi:hypothetical protein